MCNIWKHKRKDFLSVDVYKKLPSSLEMIDITGGEPFLRPDIPELIAVLHKKCPKARLLITTNGFLHDKIKKQIDSILAIDPHTAFRVSLDGIGKMHERIRGVPGAYGKALKTLKILEKAGVKDIGVIFTLMAQNTEEMRRIYAFSKKHRYNFSLNVIHDSPVYFGEGKTSLRPELETIKQDIDAIARDQMLSLNPKIVVKGWFNSKIQKHLQNHVRPLPCGAGENFFYMDPGANIYMCHLKNFPIGNLNTSSFQDIWTSRTKQKLLSKTQACQDCWLMCTTRDEIKRKRFYLTKDIMKLLFQAILKIRCLML